MSEKDADLAIINARYLARFGMILMFAGALFAIIETWYFGWNFLPKSKAELFCDFTACSISTIGVAFYLYAIVAKAITQITNL